MRNHYTALKRKIVLIMAAAAIIPLIILAAINYTEFQSAFMREMQTPFRSMISKTKNSFELFLAERSSTVSLIASLYAYEDLADPKILRGIFSAMQKEFSGFADLSLIDDQGHLVDYVGPYTRELEGVDYSGQDWFNKVRMHGRFTSEVFSGFRHVPHVIIAVRHYTGDGHAWIVRATLDTTQFDKIIASMDLEPGSDAFLLNRSGVLQTDSALFGKTLETLPIDIPAPSYTPVITETKDARGKPLLLSYVYIPETDFVLMAVKTAEGMLQNWLLVRTDLLFIFIFSALCIYFVAARSVEQLIDRLRKSDEEREKTILQMEHTQKLSSIGRLAAGVAHEVNNPLAVINEKAGLMQDMLRLENNFERRDLFKTQLASITAAVKRCKDITQRMLGFARRMDVKIEKLDLNDMLRETLTFLEKEAHHRNVAIVQQLDEKLPKILCDRGQLQQVFLNVLTNAIAAASDGGETIISTMRKGDDQVAVSFKDNGVGMDEETRSHIFEPFFTTKGEEGTGLGMSITYGIVKRHGGDIEVESEQGVGTTITIIMPIKQTITGSKQ